MKFFRNFIMWGFLFLIMSCTDEQTFSDPVDGGNGKLMTGVFRDSEVSGLTYETETQIGKTDVAGEFLFLEGENISFYLGDIYLGSGIAAAEMSPVSIASTPGATLRSTEVRNIASFLQSLDHDRNPGNGINIRDNTARAISTTDVDFINMKVQMLGEILAEVIQKTDANLKPVYSEKAAVHLNQTFGKVYVPENYTLANFLPAIESWHDFSPDAVHWIHHTGEKDRLLISSLYDKRPFRIIMQNEYTHFNAEDLPTEFLQRFYVNGSVAEEKTVRVTYTGNHHIETFKIMTEKGKFVSRLEIQNRDGHHRMDEVLHYGEFGEFLFREKIIYDKMGIKKKKVFYSSPQGSAKEGRDPYRMGTTTYAYTKHGEYRVVTHYSEEDILTDVYRYREDKTLRKSEHHKYSDSKWKRIVEYDNLENIISVTVISGD